MIFSAPIQVRCLEFLVKIPLTNDHLFYNYFVCLSVGNGRTHVLVCCSISSF